MGPAGSGPVVHSRDQAGFAAGKRHMRCCRCEKTDCESPGSLTSCVKRSPRKSGQQQLEPPHLYGQRSFAQQGMGLFLRCSAGQRALRPEALSGEIQTQIARLPKVSGVSQQYLSEATNQVLEKAFEEADIFKDEYVSAEHILLAIAARESGSGGATLVAPWRFTLEAPLLQALTSVRGSHRGRFRRPRNPSSSGRSNNTRAISPSWPAAASLIR